MYWKILRMIWIQKNNKRLSRASFCQWEPKLKLSNPFVNTDFVLKKKIQYYFVENLKIEYFKWYVVSDKWWGSKNFS